MQAVSQEESEQPIPEAEPPKQEDHHEEEEKKQS